jgi:hypothetical protein
METFLCYYKFYSFLQKYAFYFVSLYDTLFPINEILSRYYKYSISVAYAQETALALRGFCIISRNSQQYRN